uniref:Uncharacterized protein n=1 Tax=Hemiselmis andersenii TaxID=464988 RepID=A0A7S1EGI2_HEMAN|mmetsp:Transcript_47287/g.114947  ORF Transcript_47287/g.114947 Transcript_47287/m.114947 type:complete len:153 (+) Transcript_47287:85-543(+)
MRDLEKVPEELEAKGLTQQQWLAWVSKLQSVQSKAPDCCLDLCCRAFTCGIGACTCRGAGSRRPYWTALTQRQNDFNNSELQKIGVFCKTQSNSIIISDGQNSNRVTVAWIAFALDPATIAALQNEPHNTGAVGPCCGCNCGKEEQHSPMIV